MQAELVLLLPAQAWSERLGGPSNWAWQEKGFTVEVKMNSQETDQERPLIGSSPFSRGSSQTETSASP